METKMNVRNGVATAWASSGVRNCLAFAFLFASAALSSSVAAVSTQTARDCGVGEEQPPLKWFANFDGQDGWREYKSAKDIPTLVLSAGAAAFYWAGHDGHILVTLQEPGEDFGAYTHYCFNRSGRLTAIHFELRTVWGWGFREEGPIRHGKFVAKTWEYFEIKNDQPIKRPDEADEIPEALNPTLYLVKSKLPFAKLLPR
jgi:hypothetical protein